MNISQVEVVVLKPAANYWPVPVSGTICGAPCALSSTVKLPICEPVLDGVNVTETLQLFPGANALMH